jgi:hypothetical protein
MNTFQWIMVALAGIVALPMVWRRITSVVNFETTPSSTKKNYCQGLVDVVERWEGLKKCCDEQGLTEASTQLTKIFPLFAIQDKKEVKVNE